MTPTLSVEALQVSATLVVVFPVVARFVGVEGAVVSEPLLPEPEPLLPEVVVGGGSEVGATTTADGSDVAVDVPRWFAATTASRIVNPESAEPSP